MERKARTRKILQAQKKEKEFRFRGKRLVVSPSVFSPATFSESTYFASVLQIPRRSLVLEMGCGAGILSIAAILKGAKHVTAVDINPRALIDTRENASRMGVGEKITVRQSNLYQRLPFQKYDVILWNIPYENIQPKRLTLSERAVYDPGYRKINLFLRESRKRLRARGYVVVGFSPTIGNAKLLESIIQKNGYTILKKVGKNMPRAKVKGIRKLTRYELIYLKSV
jgi:methylase of polypeptide subunit release factors